MSRRDDEEHGGYPYRRHNDGHNDGHNDDGDGPPGEFNQAPVDLAAVQADDALLDMLGTGSVAGGDTDADLARVLVAWRRDVDTEAIGELVDTDTAVAVIGAARKPASRRHPVLGPAAAAAAVLVIAFSGVGLVAKSAQPGDHLFSLTKVLYADYARSAEAAQKTKFELADAESAIRRGKASEAKQSLQQAQQQLTVVGEDEGHTTLAAKHDQLEEMLAGIGSSPAWSTSPTPAPVTTSSKPQIPVPPVSVSSAPTPTKTSTSSPPPSTAPSTAVSPSTLFAPETGTPEGTPRAATPSERSPEPPPLQSSPTG
ncbi:MAG TPA: anti-sigma-D factor RsdA [Pseudonocardiaceae bacterium]|jgi:hypothetical protein